MPVTDQDMDAFTLLAGGKVDVLVMSKAQAELKLLLFHPDGKSQEYVLTPKAMTSITCQDCAGKLDFSFDNGAEQVSFEVESPALLRIFPDPSGKFWEWDSFKLTATAKSP